MPRGVKNPLRTVDDQIAELDEKISAHQAKISSLNAKKKALLASKEKAEMDALYHLLKETGKTPSELLSQLSAQDGQIGV